MATSATETLTARYLFPVSGPVVERGTVTIRGSQIAAIEPAATSGGHDDLGSVAILPGLINAHTHLEFSALMEPLGEPGMPLPEWIEQVVAWRRTAVVASTDPTTPCTAVQRGLSESLQCGVTALGEICTTDWTDRPFPQSPVSCTLFHEHIGLSPSRCQESLNSAGQWLSDFSTRCPQRPEEPQSGQRLPGLSPHAPYTVEMNLLESLCRLSEKSETPLAMHLAESPEELEYLATGGGAFATMLERLGASEPGASHRECHPYDYLLRLVKTPRLLVIHGNYLNERELDLLAEHQDTAAIVYCPRTHAYFQHASYPWESVLARHIPIALGTDSRASNPNLNLFEEMRSLLGQTPGPTPQQVLQIGTLNGARALGRLHEMGALLPGKLANLVVVRLPDRPTRDPYELLFDPQSKIIRTYVRGALVYSAAEN